MADAQNVNISLDAKSIDILRKVDAIHRDSLINVGLALVEKTGYFKTLAGVNNTEDLDDVASLDVESVDNTGAPKAVKKAEAVADAPKKPAQNWDSF